MFNEGRRYRGDFLTLITHEGTGLVGIATSRKLGEKPPRNYQKRRVKAILQSLSTNPHQDWVVVIGIKAKDADFATLSADLAKLVLKVWDDASASS